MGMHHASDTGSRTKDVGVVRIRTTPSNRSAPAGKGKPLGAIRLTRGLTRSYLYIVFGMSLRRVIQPNKMRFTLLVTIRCQGLKVVPEIRSLASQFIADAVDREKCMATWARSA